MLISNGIIKRNIDEKQLPVYKAKGYEVVKVATSTPPKAPKKSGDK